MAPQPRSRQRLGGQAGGGWQRWSAGEGTKGARLYGWAYLELAGRAAEGVNPALSGTWTRGLLIRRNISGQSLAGFSTWCPQSTGIETLVAVEGSRWASEDAFETAKTELGLTHNETRRWHGWHRHVSLVMLAFAVLARVRQRVSQAPPKRRRACRARASRIRCSVQEIRRPATRLAQRRIRPAHVIACSLWRRAHQADAQRSHLLRRLQTQL